MESRRGHPGFGCAGIFPMLHQQALHSDKQEHDLKQDNRRIDHPLAVQSDGNQVELNLHLRQSPISASSQAVVLLSLAEQAFDFPFAFRESLAKGRR